MQISWDIHIQTNVRQMGRCAEFPAKVELLPQGAAVAEVVADSPAEQSGLQVNDIITAVNGTAITGSTDLVNTVKGYAAHETQTFTEVTEARAKATSINLSADDLTPERLAQFQRAQAEVRSALGRLIAVSESYPDLKANQNFLELQAQLEGTENRIAVARKDFNAAAQQYNVSVRRFPANLVARMFGFGQKPYFESAEGAAAAPQVTF